jgi:hypothetical protein
MQQAYWSESGNAKNAIKRLGSKVLVKIAAGGGVV